MDVLEIMARKVNSADPFCVGGWIHDRTVARMIVAALDEAGFAIVPKDIPAETIAAAGLDADDAGQYAALVERCAIKP